MAKLQSIHPPPSRNANNPLVEQATALGAEAPVFDFDKWPAVAQCWKDRALWFIAHHSEMSIEERRRRLFDLDIYGGAPMIGRRRKA